MSGAAGDRATAIFFALSTVPPDDRARVLDERCGGDAALKRDVERLLRGLDLPEATLAMAAPRPDVAGGPAPAAGTLVADFVIVRQIGAGGTGVVYLAHQRHPPRVVALKVLRREYLATAVRRRFEIEAELLASLHHPGIAQIFAADPGDETTEPFIAMELVSGPPLTEFADARQLSVRERVELVARVCDAVQHAHQRGVIHRDLKPGNILVSEDGQPKVLDFGVARRITVEASPATIATETGQLVGTLAYMSPEQVLAVPDAIDTRTDIYTLGVILFRLLAGRLPFAHDDPPLPELARRIVQDEPPKLGAIDPGLRGDLEVIVARALAKEKERRYAAAAGLAADLRRYLDGRPISASADSAWYLVRRQLGRYRLAFGLSAAMLVAVSALAFYANTQRARADDTNRRLEDQLATSTIERARLIGLTGNHPAAEELAWRELFRKPDSRHARWTLWELYSRAPSLWTQIVHDKGTQSVRLSPDGRLLLTAGRVDGLLHLIDVPSGRIVRTLTTNPLSGTRRALFTADGKTIVSGSDDGTLRVWDVGSGELRREIPKAMPVLFDLSISPDGATAVTVALGRVEVWSLATGQRTVDLSSFIAPASAAAISPTGPLVVIGSDRGDVVAVDLVRLSKRWQARAHGGLVTGVTFTPDGRVVATSSFDSRVQIRNAATGESIRAIHTESGRARNVAFDTTGTIMAVGAQWRSLLYDLAHPEAPARDIGGSEGTTHVDLSADGRVMATCNGASGQVRAWDLAADPRVRQWRQPGSVRALSVSPDGSVIAAGNQGLMSIWRSDQAAVVASFTPPGNVYGFDISADGRWLVTVGSAGSGAVWDLEDRSRVAELTGLGSARSVAFADDDRLIFTGEPDGTLRTWEWANGVAKQIRSTPASSGEILSMAAHRPLVFAGYTDHLVAVVEARTGRELGRMRTDAAPFVIAAARDGRHFAAGTYLGSVDVWDVATGRRVESVKGQTALVNGLDFSPDSSLLAIASRDGSTRIWDVNARQSLAVITTRKIAAERVRFLPGGERLVIGYADGTVDVVDLNHFLRHVAGNAEYQSRLFHEAGERFPRSADVIAWSRRILGG